MANTKFQLKRSSVSGVVPTTGDISTAELGINVADRKLFSSNGTVVFELGSNLSSLSVTGDASVSANLTIGAAGELVITNGAGIYANGTLGTAGQVLTSNATGVYWSTAAGGGGGGSTLVANNTDTQTFYIPMANTTSGTWSNAVVSTTKFYFVPSTGTLNATIFNSLSDFNKKFDVLQIKDASATVSKLRGVEFSWNDTGRKSAGVIAQEIEKVLPHLVDENNGIKSVNYLAIIGYLIESNKELQARIAALENN